MAWWFGALIRPALQKARSFEKEKRLLEAYARGKRRHGAASEGRDPERDKRLFGGRGAGRDRGADER